MEKLTFTKITSLLVIFVFLVSFLLPISQLNAAASAGGNASLYSNPNQDNGKNPYRFKTSDVLNSEMLTSVVGCTGIVNKTAKFMSGMMQSPKQQLKIAQDKIDKVRNQLRMACASTKAAGETAADSAPTMPGFSKAVDTILSKVDGALGLVTGTKSSKKEKICLDAVEAMDPKMLEEIQKQTEEEAARNFKEQCFDGIAITLAKNQLTAMARSTMNWVNTGYGGNPLFVQNMRNLTYNIEKNVVETGIDVLLAPKNASPYAADFARTTLNNRGIMASSTRFLGGLQSDLSNFVADPRSYYSNEQLEGAYDTRTSLQRAEDANRAFSRDFASGGWNAWLALTQREQNNPLGFNMVANQYLYDTQAQVISDKRAEITQNGGFMSQTQCLEWQMFDKDGKMIDANMSNGESSVAIPTLTKTRPNEIKDGINPYGVCFNSKTITPGTLIKDKVSDYLNSPERQLELVKTINDSLNVLFSVLITKLQGGGLTGLSDSSANISNWTDNMNSLTSSSNYYDNNGAYNDFNLTRDLGNTYLHEPAVRYGTWDAKNNWTTGVNKINSNKKLYPTLNPEIYDAETQKPILTNNAYYVVDTAGKTKLINEGYNSWEVGDRAFWDGKTWQNWKKNQKSPIVKRGVIQTQEDYIVAAKEVLQVLPRTMTALGELDYCIPGPNPSYKTNSTDAQSAYQDWVNSIYTGPLNGSDMDRSTWTIDRENSSSYKNLANIFADNPGVWKQISNSNFIAWFLNYFGPFSESANKLGYWYHGTGKDFGGAKYDEAVKLQKFTTDYTNSNLFQNFYEVFDKMMDKVYFKNMTRKYNDTETSIGSTPNPSYVPMAQAGLDLTKDIVYYGDDNDQKIKEYEDAIAQAKINIAKLQPIRDEVSGIIEAAQERRDKNLLLQINKVNAKAKDTCRAEQIECDNSTENIKSCTSKYDTCINTAINNGGILTEKAYLVKYKDCLEEENIQVFDADGILGRGSKAEENCNDELDNDLNGLTDAKDPACKEYTTTPTSPSTETKPEKETKLPKTRRY